MEGAAETLGNQTGSSMMNFFFPSVVGIKETSPVTQKIGESSPAAGTGQGPIPRKTRRLVSTATEPETPADETMQEERWRNGSDTSQDDSEDPEWYGSGSEIACLDIDDTSETSSLRTYGVLPDDTEQSDRPVECGMLYDRAVVMDPVDVLYKVKGVREWYRGRLETNSESLHSDTWEITFWEPDGSFESSDVFRLCSRDVWMVDNEAAATDDIHEALVLEIVEKYEIYPLSGVAVETVLESVRRTYVKEKEVFVEALLGIVKQTVFQMIRAGKLMVGHEEFAVTSYFVQSIQQLDRTGLLVYVPDFVPEASSRPLTAADVYEPDCDSPPQLSAADTPEMDEFLALRDSDADDEDPETADLIARAMVDIYTE
jgi:hypothetical protein